MLKCLISWNPRLRLCYQREVDPSSPCGSPSRYELLPRGSLDAHLFVSKSLGWDARVKVASGTSTRKSRSRSRSRSGGCWCGHGCLDALADPAMQGRYSRRGLYQVAVIASLCLHDKRNLRPTMTDVTRALEHVASQPWRLVRDGHQEEQAAAGGSSRRGRGRGGTPRASTAAAHDT